MTLRGALGAIGCGILSVWMILSLVFLLVLLLPTRCTGQSPRWRDRDSIAAALARVDTVPGISLSHGALSAVLAIAWEETAGNDSTPGIRGHHCWYTISARTDTSRVALLNGQPWPWSPDTQVVVTRHLRLVHHEKDCEVGRFQIKPSTARLRCPGWNVFTYDGNLACFAQMFADDTRKGGTLYAIKRQNGSGRKADEYVNRVLRIVGWMTLQTNN